MTTAWPPRWNRAILAIAALLLPSTALSQALSTESSALSDPIPAIRPVLVWPFGGSVGFAVSAGAGTTRFGGRDPHDFVLATASWSKPLSSWGRDDWRTLWELRFEGAAGAQVRPTTREFYGLTPMLRVGFPVGSRWVPFVNAGIGASYTNIREPDLSTRFQFNDQAGIGVEYLMNSGWALLVEGRFMHLSNGGFAKPNNGTNTFFLRLGASRPRGLSGPVSTP